jgi:hypothetical protein
MPKETLFKLKTNKFIETGSYEGGGIELALESGFDTVYSIEITDHYYNFCCEKFKDNPKVKMVNGDSYIELEKLISLSDEPFTYWLDGHYSGGNTGIGIELFPIMQELESILKRGVDGEVIYIDDMRCLRNYSEDINEKKMIELVHKYKKSVKIYSETTESGVDDILIIEY